MIFLLLVLYCLLFSLIVMVRSMTVATTAHARHPPLYFLFMFSPALLTAALLTSFGLLATPSDSAVWFLPVMLFCSGCLGAIASLLIIALNQTAIASPQRISRLWWIATALSSLYFAGIAIDHLVFFEGGKTGVISMQLARDTDVHCDADTLLVRLEPTTARYRCPHNLRLGNSDREPFVPWPSYAQGESRLLDQRVHRIMNEIETPTTRR